MLYYASPFWLQRALLVCMHAAFVRHPVAQLSLEGVKLKWS
jgi:hypothetical protein